MSPALSAILRARPIKMRNTMTPEIAAVQSDIQQALDAIIDGYPDSAKTILRRASAKLDRLAPTPDGAA